MHFLEKSQISQGHAKMMSIDIKNIDDNVKLKVDSHHSLFEVKDRMVFVMTSHWRADSVPGNSRRLSL